MAEFMSESIKGEVERLRAQGNANTTDGEALMEKLRNTRYGTGSKIQILQEEITKSYEETKKKLYGNDMKGTFYRFLDNLGMYDVSRHMRKGEKVLEQKILIMEDARNRLSDKIRELSSLSDEARRNVEVLKEQYGLYEELDSKAKSENSRLETEISRLYSKKKTLENERDGLQKEGKTDEVKERSVEIESLQNEVSSNATEKNCLITDRINIDAYRSEIDGYLNTFLDDTETYQNLIDLDQVRLMDINECLNNARRTRLSMKTVTDTDTNVIQELEEIKETTEVEEKENERVESVKNWYKGVTDKRMSFGRLFGNRNKNNGNGQDKKKRDPLKNRIEEKYSDTKKRLENYYNTLGL